MIRTTTGQFLVRFSGQVGTGVFTAAELDELIEAARQAKAILATVPLDFPGREEAVSAQQAVG